MTRKVAGLNGNAALTQCNEASSIICDFIDEFGSDYIEEIVNESLQAWICPDDYSSMSLRRIADAVGAVKLIGKLVSKLEA